jgi:hypothetical protein
MIHLQIIYAMNHKSENSPNTQEIKRDKNRRKQDMLVGTMETQKE